MPRKRKTNKHLPMRVYVKKNAYRLLTREGKWIRLGKTMSEMYSTLATLELTNYELKTVSSLFDRYMKEIAPQKSESSLKANLIQSKFLCAYFGNMIPTDVSAVDIYRYLDMRGKTAKISANRELALLSHVFSYAIRWGSVKLNPCTGVKKFSENKRSRNVTDEEFLAVMTEATYPIKHAMNLTYMMGLRPTEVLKLKRSNIRDEGLYVDITKTKKGAKGKIVEWSEPLKKLVTELSQMNKYKISHLDYLLCNRVGQPYTPEGFTTMWKRHMKKCVEKGILKEPFQFRDIRHKSATDIEKMYSREDARKLLGHTSQTTTARYIDGVNIVKGVTK